MNKRRALFAAIMLAVVISLLHADPGFCEGKSKYEKSIHDYSVPDVTLINQDGIKVSLETLVSASDKPVLLDFIFATCTTICPVLSVGFSSFQKKLGPEAEDVRLVSISIDPDNDKPEVMKEYLQRYKARPGWDFLTGSREDIDRVMRAFDAFVPNKMSHQPLNFIRVPGKEGWVRLNGLMGTSDLVKEYRELLKR